MVYLKVHAVSVPYAVNLFQGTQLFNRELTIKPRNNNTNSNVQQKVENPMPVQPHPSAIRNPFDGNSRNGNGNGVDNERTRVERVVDQPNPLRMQYDQSSLRSGFQPIPTKASMQMQPQPSKRFDNQKQTNPTSMDDLNKLLSLGSNMLQPSSSQRDTSKRQPYDMQFADRAASEKQSSNLKMTNRHKSRSHYRDEPYSRRDPQHHHHHRSNNDRRRR